MEFTSIARLRARDSVRPRSLYVPSHLRFRLTAPETGDEAATSGLARIKTILHNNPASADRPVWQPPVFDKKCSKPLKSVKRLIAAT